MKALCLKTIISNPNNAIVKSGWTSASEYLTIGKTYDVFAIWHQNSYMDWYLICTDLFDDDLNYIYPRYIPASFFQIVDNVKPMDWIIHENYEGPKELMGGNYIKLVEGDPFRNQSFRHILYNQYNK